MNGEPYCVIDIGGTKILLLLIDNNKKVIFRKKIDTPKPAEPAAVVRATVNLVAEAMRSAGRTEKDKPAAVGLCFAGFLNHNSGIVYRSPNLEWKEPVPLQKLLNEKLDCPVMIENDASAAVVGEVIFGAAKGHRSAVYVTLSTGIGGGLFLDGRLYRGSDGFAGEIGHIKPFGRGRDCKCGGFDCLETWASGSAIARSASMIWPAEDFERAELDTAWVFEQADEGNVIAQEIVTAAAQATGRGLSNLVNILNPSCLVIGGGVAANRPDFLDRVSRVIFSEAIKPAVEITSLRVVPAALEPEAGIWGMYALITGRAE